MSIRDEARVVGWTFAVGLTPLVLMRRLGVINMHVCPNRGFPEPSQEWVRTEWCNSTCQTDTDFEYRLWVDESIVTKECLSCGTVSNYEDRV